MNTKSFKRFGLVAVTLVLLASIVTAVFANDLQTVDLSDAEVGVYYEQSIDITEDLKKNPEFNSYITKYNININMIAISKIEVVSGSVPPGLKIDYGGSKAKFSGTPTKAGSYSFGAKVSLSYMGVPLDIVLERFGVTTDKYPPVFTINIKVNPASPKAPVFVNKPLSEYAVPSSSSITVPVSATCPEGCGFKLYYKGRDGWNLVDSKSGAGSWDMKPLDAAGVKSTVGSHQFKVEAVNQSNQSLVSECAFTVKVEQKAPTLAVITGNTQMTEGDTLAIVCTSDGDNLTYQWQIKLAGSSSWQNIGKNESTLSVTALLSYDGGSVQCIVSNSGGSKTSNAITLKIAKKHTCQYTTSTVVLAATCTTDGEMRQSCSCGKYITTAIKSEGHKYSSEWHIESHPGCVTPGSKSHRCTVCQEKTDLTVIEPKGHIFSSWKTVKEATTTEEGLQRRECSSCGATEEKTIAKVVAGHEHSFSDWVVSKEATCDESGLKKKTCSCGQVETEIIGATGHSFYTEYTVIKDATCTESGSKSRKCSKCSAQTDVVTISPKGHSYGAWTVFKEATVESEGEERRYCTDCQNYESKTIAKLVAGHTHSFGAWVLITPPTCDGVGTELRTCSCNSAETRQVSPKGHSFGAWEIIRHPTSEVEGLELCRCLVEGCNKTDSRTIAKLAEGVTPDATPTPTPTPTPDEGGQTDMPATQGPGTGGHTDPVEKDDDEMIKYLLFTGCGLLGGILIVLIVILLLSRKKSRWE